MDELTLEQKKEYESLVAKAIAAGQRQEDAEAKSIEDLRAEFPPDPPDEKEDEPEGLMAMSLERIHAINAKGLRAICKDNDMSTDGKREDFLNRVLAIRFGRTKKYIGAETRCTVCGNEVMVKGTNTTIMGDGRRLVVRSIRCKDRHAHTYQLKEIV